METAWVLGWRLQAVTLAQPLPVPLDTAESPLRLPLPLAYGRMLTSLRGSEDELS